MSARLVGGVAVALGLALLALCVPLVGRTPLYDGVVVTEPYVFLHPGPGEAGGPVSFSEVFDVIGGESPILSAGTGESPPQASVYGNQGDLVVGSTTTSFKIDIDPIEPPDQPKDGNLAGNVYDISVTDQLGMPVVPTPGGGFSVVLRQPEDISGKATTALFVDGEWRFVESRDAGSRGFYVSTPPELGVFALIVGGSHLPTLPPLSPPTPAATVVTTARASGLPATAQGAPTITTSTPSAASSRPPVQPTLPPGATPSTSPSEPPSTSLVVAALLVLIALAAVVALMVARGLSRRR
jgi:hypothetical protein